MITASQKEQLDLIENSKNSSLIHDVDFNCFKNIDTSSSDINIIDVGANRGQSIVSFKSIFPNAKIVSFEANPFFEPILIEVSKWYDDVYVNNFGLGHTEQQFEFYVPVIDGTPYLEEGSTRRDNFEKPWVRDRFLSYGSSLEYKTFPVNIKRAEDVITDAKTDIIKIDVEGAEMDVLSSMDQIIERSHPIFLIENSDFDNVTSFLKNKGYQCYQYLSEDNFLIPLKTDCTNSFYIHNDYNGPLLSIIQD